MAPVHKGASLVQLRRSAGRRWAAGTPIWELRLGRPRWQKVLVTAGPPTPNPSSRPEASHHHLSVPECGPIGDLGTSQQASGALATQ